MDIRRHPGINVRMPAISLFAIFLTCYWSRGAAQSCLTCIPSDCSLDPSTCPYGAVKDYCGCCDECLKGPGGKCGGFHGKCANGSRCYVKLDFGISYILYVQTPGFCEEINPSSALPSTPSPSLTQSTAPTSASSSCYSSPPAALSSVASASSLSSSSSSIPTPTPPPAIKCRPPCSKELCSDGRNRYCSSNSTLSKPRNTVEERIPCQHTTCLACRIHVRPKCPTCPVPVTKRCLRHFFLCLSEHYKRTDIFLAMSDPRAQSAVGDIVCDVPSIEEVEEEGEGSGHS